MKCRRDQRTRDLNIATRPDLRNQENSTNRQRSTTSNVGYCLTDLHGSPQLFHVMPISQVSQKQIFGICGTVISILEPQPQLPNQKRQSTEEKATDHCRFAGLYTDRQYLN